MVRQSPNEHAKEFKYEIRKGLDGNMWTSQPDINNVFKWKRVPPSTTKTIATKKATKKNISTKKTTKKSTNKTTKKNTTKQTNKTETNKKSMVKKTSKITNIRPKRGDVTLYFQCGTKGSSLNLRIKETQIKIHDILKLQIEVCENNEFVKNAEIVFMFKNNYIFVEFTFLPLTSISKIQSFLMDLVDSLQDGAEDGYLGGGDEVRVDNSEIIFDMFESRGKWNKKWPRFYTN